MILKVTSSDANDPDSPFISFSLYPYTTSVPQGERVSREKHGSWSNDPGSKDADDHDNDNGDGDGDADADDADDEACF